MAGGWEYPNALSLSGWDLAEIILDEVCQDVRPINELDAADWLTYVPGSRGLLATRLGREQGRGFHWWSLLRWLSNENFKRDFGIKISTLQN
jgi:hypothetical protein